MKKNGRFVGGLDVGTECVKAIIMTDERQVLGRSVVPTRGPFADRAHEALTAALDEAQISLEDLEQVCGTGFAPGCSSAVTFSATESKCHARGAFHHAKSAMTVIDIGGREPKVIHVDESGRRTDSRSARKCAMGIGTFLMFAARHLDVHPTRLGELAASAERPASIGSYCSVFAGTEILERLREGVSPAEIALGCMRSVAERIFEIGGFQAPLIVTGGVAEYFPGVLQGLIDMTGHPVRSVPEPISAGAIGAALLALETLRV